jgi:ABC-2 type transport system ATP-binding protein
MQPVLSVRNIVKKYGKVVAVDGISFDVVHGEILGFLGPNGAGKTTTIKMLCGLLSPDSGEIRKEGGKTDMTVGICPQNIVIWENLSPKEQIQFAGEMHGLSSSEARNRADILLDTFVLREKENALAKTLSGGMQRRLNIALALVHKPKLLFLDEPQAGLDPQSRVLVRDYIKSLRGDTTIVLTTHDMEEAEKMSDRVCIIDRGKVLVSGTIEEIKKTLGEGDLIEIQIDGNIGSDLVPHLEGKMRGILEIGEDTITCVAERAYDSIPLLLDILKEHNVGIEDFRVRRKSLEDVFINLTGRGLRE